MSYFCRLYLNQPWLQFVVDDDVVSIALKTVAVIRHYRRHRFQRVHDAPGDISEQFLRDRLSARALQIQAQILHAQLATVLAVVFVLKIPQLIIRAEAHRVFTEVLFKFY